MTTFTIDEQNQIVAFATPEAAAAVTATPFDAFTTQAELAELAANWPSERLLAIWNTLPGVAPVKKLKDNKAVVGRIWTRIQSLAEPAPKPAQKAKAGARAAKGAPAKATAKRKPAPAKRAQKAKAARKSPATEPRPDSKTAQVIAMLRRKNGAKLSEIMEKMGWQQHTVRGFMAGAMKKAGFAVESFKPEGGERSYRLPSE